MSAIAAPSRPTLINWVEIFGLGMIWGASFLAVHLALDGIGPFGIATGRIVFAAVTLSLLCLVRRLPLPSLRKTPKIWLHATGMAFFSNVLPFTLLSWAQQHVTSGFAGITMAMVPLFTVSLAHLFLPGERLSRYKVTGFAIGLVGVVILIGTDALDTVGTELEPVARLVCIGATLSYAIGSIITRRCPPVDPIAFSTTALLVASAMILPVALLVEGLPHTMPPVSALAALAYLGLLPTAFATLVLVHVIRTAGPTFLTMTNYHVPVWSVIFGTVILAEPLPPQFLIALGLILLGLLISRIGLKRIHASSAMIR
ncbi:DMT family transporter [Pararhodobacter sp.]|uniref:DMT family transporter n=1 Tax=Pararhodobacter sp. TaxID=2127056 RepID=UPI002AFF5A3F|nr:EamA family transporter [Pararhodobacter sp.]